MIKKLNYIVLSTIIVFTIITSTVCCKKEEIKTHDVTYTFSSSSNSYTIQIWDATGQHDISETISAKSYSRTIKYDYDGTFRCSIESALPSKMTISITYDGVITTCSDSLFSSIECFRNI